MITVANYEHTKRYKNKGKRCNLFNSLLKSPKGHFDLFYIILEMQRDELKNVSDDESWSEIIESFSKSDTKSRYETDETTFLFR